MKTFLLSLVAWVVDMSGWADLRIVLRAHGVPRSLSVGYMRAVLRRRMNEQLLSALLNGRRSPMASPICGGCGEFETAECVRAASECTERKQQQAAQEAEARRAVIARHGAGAFRTREERKKVPPPAPTFREVPDAQDAEGTGRRGLGGLRNCTCVDCAALGVRG